MNAEASGWPRPREFFAGFTLSSLPIFKSRPINYWSYRLTLNEVLTYPKQDAPSRRKQRQKIYTI